MNPNRVTMLAKIDKFRDMIQLRLEEAVDDPAHYEKVFWFAEYFNEVFSGVGAKLVEARDYNRGDTLGPADRLHVGGCKPVRQHFSDTNMHVMWVSDLRV
jgi:hypothetical protein